MILKFETKLPIGKNQNISLISRLNGNQDLNEHAFSFFNFLVGAVRQGPTWESDL